MSHALSHAFHDVDPKRVAATSATIAVHALVVMLLLAPPALLPAKSEPTTIVVPTWTPPKPIPVMPPPPIIDPVRRPPEHTTPRPAVVPDPPPVVTDEQFANAIPVDPVVAPTIESSFEPPAPGPVALAVRIGPAPTYPSREVRMGITGRVLLRVEVDAEGKPVNVTIEQSSGNSALDKAAQLTVMRKWRFVPAQRNGENVAAVGLVPIDFVLD